MGLITRQSGWEPSQGKLREGSRHTHAGPLPPPYLPALRMTAEQPTSVSPTASRPSLAALPPGAISSMNTSAGGPTRSASTSPSGLRSVSRMVCAAGAAGDAATGALHSSAVRKHGCLASYGRRSARQREARRRGAATAAAQTFVLTHHLLLLMTQPEHAHTAKP